ncbi:MAG: hypothetical protein ABIH34_01905 [Nanoarchaeota archaeon]
MFDENRGLMIMDKAELDAIRKQVAEKGYAPFEGPNKERMPDIIEAGLAPMSTAWIAKMLLAKKGGEEEAFPYAYGDSGDGAPVFADGSAAVALDAPYLLTLGPDTDLVDYGLPIGDRALLGDHMLHFSPEEVAQIHGQQHKGKKFKDSDYFQFILRDPAPGNSKVRAIIPAHMRQPGLVGAVADGWANQTGITPYFHSKGDQDVGWLWCLNGGNSDLYGDTDLDYGGGRLFGGAPEARAAGNIAVLEKLVKAYQQPIGSGRMTDGTQYLMVPKH